MTSKKQNQKEDLKGLFAQVKSNFLDYDPAHFIQNNLTLDGQPFSILGNGWKFMADVYRYIALQATRKNGKSVVIKKGRQVGATMMAGALDLYFTNSGLFSNPPIRVAHLFPSIILSKRFSQDKLENLIRTAKNDFVNNNKLKDKNAIDNQSAKQFKTGTLWVESIGADGDRIRGMTIDVGFFDECFPYNQHINTLVGPIKIGDLYSDFRQGRLLPEVKSFNEQKNTFEFKKILKVFKREKREIISLKFGQKKVKCTPNHKFLTNDSWKEAKNLKIGDLIKSYHENDSRKIRSLNEDQYQIMLGSFLGDGNLKKSLKNRYRLRFTHGLKQEEYCRWKADMLDAKVYSKKPSGYANKPSLFASTKFLGIDKPLPNKKDTCPQWILDEIDARGLAIWFMDDGSTIFRKNGSASAKISTCSFDEDSQKRIVEKLKSLGIECHYYKEERVGEKFKQKVYYSIYFNSKGTESLFNLIRPYIHNNMFYKVTNCDKDKCNYVWNDKYNDYSYTVVEDIEHLNKKEFVYDIEVEDNHNFIICSKNNKNGQIVHNCQDMPSSAIGNSTKTLTAAKYGQIGKGIQVYFGTPKEKGTHFENIWEESDQRYYNLGCKSCKKTFPFYLPNNDDWKKIWISEYNIQCPLCGHIQHKVESIELGEWVATKNTDDCKFVGFHINQFYIPNLTREYINELMPENNLNQSERNWNNEVIGEFYSGAGMPLTRTHIELYCKDPDRAFATNINPKNKKTYFGIDWGDKTDENSSGQSFSCAVVLSDAGDGTLLIEHAHKLKERTLSYKKETVNEIYKRFGIKQGISDFFFAQDIVRELQGIWGEKLLGAQGSSSLVNPVKYRDDELIVTYNKDLMIEELFDKIRRGKIRFPWKSYEKIEWLIEHCTSMGTRTKERGGQQIKTYVKGSTPNDGLMALMYAYMAWKFDSTNKFSIKPGTKENLGRPRPGLAFVPKLKI